MSVKSFILSRPEENHLELESLYCSQLSGSQAVLIGSGKSAQWSETGVKSKKIRILMELGIFVLFFSFLKQVETFKLSLK